MPPLPSASLLLATHASSASPASSPFLWREKSPSRIGADRRVLSTPPCCDDPWLLYILIGASLVVTVLFVFFLDGCLRRTSTWMLRVGPRDRAREPAHRLGALPAELQTAPRLASSIATSHHPSELEMSRTKGTFHGEFRSDMFTPRSQLELMGSSSRDLLEILDVAAPAADATATSQTV